MSYGDYENRGSRDFNINEDKQDKINQSKTKYSLTSLYNFAKDCVIDAGLANWSYSPHRLENRARTLSTEVKNLQKEGKSLKEIADKLVKENPKLLKNIASIEKFLQTEKRINQTEKQTDLGKVLSLIQKEMKKEELKKEFDEIFEEHKGNETLIKSGINWLLGLEDVKGNLDNEDWEAIVEIASNIKEETGTTVFNQKSTLLGEGKLTALDKLIDKLKKK